MTEETGIVRATEGGVSGLSARGQWVASVAPATTDELNTLRASIKPFACWKVDDMRFAFDSSVVQPEIKEDLASLLDLIRRTTAPNGAPPLLSVFGHADPTGSDAYNKKLSGRRARAIYALLTRNVKMWENLAADADGTNDHWDTEALELMSTALGRSAPARDPASRGKLYRDYMDFLCHCANPDGNLLVEPQHFLGRAADSDGKGDFHGCGEHNPLLLLSRRDEQTLAREDYNTANGGNRRVTVLLFRPGTKIDLAYWPCPTADEGPEGCRRRFFKDHERRQRADAEERRRFDEGNDTFRCRFYETLSTRSPCESPRLLEGQAFLAVRVFFDARPMQGLAVKFSTVAGTEIGDALGDPVLTDDTGLAVFTRTVPIGNYVCEVEYQRPEVVCTVFDKAQPEILVLPIGRSHVHIDGDLEIPADGESS